MTTHTTPAYTGQESSLSNWAGPYVTDMLGKGQALSGLDYQQYSGPLTAGISGLQSKAFNNASNMTLPSTMGTYSPTDFSTANKTGTYNNGLTMPANTGAYTPGSFTATGIAGEYMNPYINQVITGQQEEARRQAEISRVQNAGRMAAAGSFGGGRQAIMESEGDRNLQTLLNNIYGTGMNTAYNSAQGQFNVEEAAKRDAQAANNQYGLNVSQLGQNQFNTEQNRAMAAQSAANQYGLDAINLQNNLGAIQRGVTSEGIAADYAQFQEERDDPYKKVQYQQSLLQGMPVGAQSYSTTQPTGFSSLLEGGGGILDLLQKLQDLGG